MQEPDLQGDPSILPHLDGLQLSVGGPVPDVQTAAVEAWRDKDRSASSRGSGTGSVLPVVSSLDSSGIVMETASLGLGSSKADLWRWACFRVSHPARTTQDVNMNRELSSVHVSTC